MIKRQIYFSSAIFLLLFSCMSFSGEPKFSEDGRDLSLWYTAPAKYWESEALPLGNGKIGAMVFGGIQREQYTLNEKTLWEGGKGENPDYNFGNKSGGKDQLENIRSLVRDGDYTKAMAEANKHLTGDPLGYGAYQVLGDMFLEFEGQGGVSNYYRGLDLTNGVHTVSYKSRGVNYVRESFISYPDNLMVVRLKADRAGALNFSLNLTSPTQGPSYYEGYFGKKLPAEKQGRKIEVNGFHDLLVLDGILNNNGMKFQTVAKILNLDGEVSVGGEVNSQYLEIADSSEVVIILTAATDYLHQYPDYTGRDYRGDNSKVIQNGVDVGYKALLDNHLADYEGLFDRVDLSLGNSEVAGYPTDVRLHMYQDKADPGLDALIFQYARYLMISSSRAGSLPANLQGIWNNSTNPPWSADYHTNINLQMNYWITGPGNLSECDIPLIEFIDELRKPGRDTAREYYNSGGWATNTMVNPFGFTAPGWMASWGHFPAGAAWLSRHLYTHFMYTQDMDFLANTAYPIIKEAATFWLDYLVEEDGKLVSLTSYSPEHGEFERGAMMDHMIAWDIFSNCIELAKILSSDEEFVAQLVAARDKIAGPFIGQHGQLQEWMRDIDSPLDKHRHVSHLYALHPGRQISPITTPEFADAAKVSLEFRGDGGTGWSRAWKINFWARLGDGDRAYKLMKSFLNPLKKAKMNYGAGGIYHNLFCSHPPFQIDGNFGAAAGIAEMLVQSHMGFINLHPALPSAWAEGSIRGIGAKGGFEVSLDWRDGQIERAEILSKAGKQLNIVYGDTENSISTSAGKVYVFDGALRLVEIK
ncbi:MAG: glycoside hydrolase family 95 protein [Spirochaetales bacterium]|nr:glycoside hydrolase family 95 protein [Spirochaetales bacterium]